VVGEREPEESSAEQKNKCKCTHGEKMCVATQQNGAVGWCVEVRATKRERTVREAPVRGKSGVVQCKAESYRLSASEPVPCVAVSVSHGTEEYIEYALCCLSFNSSAEVVYKAM